MEGWIKLHRCITENELYFSERFTKMQAWTDLLLLATHKPQTVFIRGIELHLQEGELCYSQLTLSKRWKWNRRTVDKFLSMLEKREMIHNRTSRVTTIISILKWSEYQNTTQQTAQQSSNRMHTNNNDKNEKNVVVTNNDYETYIARFKEALINNNIPFSGRIELRLEKMFGEFGRERMIDAGNVALRNWLQNGHTEGDFISYFSKIVKEDYATAR